MYTYPGYSISDQQGFIHLVTKKKEEEHDLEVYLLFWYPYVLFECFKLQVCFMADTCQNILVWSPDLYLNVFCLGQEDIPVQCMLCWMYRQTYQCLGLFQKLSLGGGPHFFSRPLHTQDTHGVRAPQPPGHISALINPPHYGSNIPWPPGQVTPPPLGHIVNKTPSPPTGQKSACGPPLPEDNFWNSP